MLPKAGDVYCVFVEKLNKYTACQITKLYNDKIFKNKLRAVLLELDWVGVDLPSEDELKNIKPLYCDFMFWNNRVRSYNISPNVPLHFKYVGNIPPLFDDDSTVYSSAWNVGYPIYRQSRWCKIPEELRNKFKAAHKGDERVILMGHEMKANSSSIYDSTVDFRKAAELAVLPCLTKIICEKWHDDILDFLKKNPFITDLTIKNHNQTSLDFRESHLLELSIQMDCVETLYLNDDLERVILLGDTSHPFTIHAKDDGKWLDVQFNKTVIHDCGIPRLGKLYCTQIDEFDIGNVFSAYPDIKEFRIWGKPGYIRNFKSVTLLKKLQGFSTFDLFGFSGEDIPLPEELPNLNWLWMTSLPQDAAKKVKMFYKKQAEAGLDLNITKPRKPEWLAENMDNPFRGWDGQEHISGANAKKAAAIYKRTRNDILNLVAAGSSDLQTDLDKIVLDYTESFNKIDKRTTFIETDEREEIYKVLCELLELIPQESAFDKNPLLGTFDNKREF